MSLEPKTLAELQAAKDHLETRARPIREALPELVRLRPDGWQTELERAKYELRAIKRVIGKIDRKIRKLVEREIVTTEDDDIDV